MLLRTLFINCSLLLSLHCLAKTIVVKNIDELNTANKKAQPGDNIILQNGEWKNVTLSLTCHGTKEMPITYKAETAGKVLITGNSKLKIGGNYIIVDGLYFLHGFSGSESIITFRNNTDEIANNCRVTNTVINDFNNQKRLDDNYWISIYGKNNRLDHCSFLNKKNLGVLLAVILDDERSRENFHSIDHNYFGIRLPLASNAGEIIRVGVSQHCEFNSNTQIMDNYFEHCDGEGEIISIKSGNNIIRNNLFKECQGAIVLRHGNFNTVENNVFLGYNKIGTGGIRVINKGQWVVNNFHYQCRGEGFRSPLTIMNGVPNSPANRYVAVTEALITNNTYVDCTPISLCEGSDTERSVTPSNVLFLKNVFYSTLKMQLAKIHDSITGIRFAGNLVNQQQITLNLPVGFTASSFSSGKNTILPIPQLKIPKDANLDDSLIKIGLQRLFNPLSNEPGFSDNNRLATIQKNAIRNSGAGWFIRKNNIAEIKEIRKDCKNAEEIKALIATNKKAKLTINLTSPEYIFSTPLDITSTTTFISTKKKSIRFSINPNGSDFMFQIKAGASLHFKNLQLDLKALNVQSFVSSDTTGSSNHTNFSMNDCSISNLEGTFYSAAKSNVSDSIIIRNTSFSNGKGVIFNFSSETDKKGYYNTEKLVISNNRFNNHSGQILAMLRGGNDESTMGPHLLFTFNTLTNCNTSNSEAVIYNYGTQLSQFENNKFTNCNPDKILLQFEDAVRAKHLLRNNILKNSGKIITNKYVVEGNNVSR